MGDTGDCTTFLESFTINSTFITAYGNQLYINLSGVNLEIENGDNATIVTAGVNDLLITSITHQGTFLGLTSSIDSNVADENGLAISGGLCDINVEDPSNDHVLETVRSTMIDGNLDFIWLLEYEEFKESKDYVGKVSCFCGSAGSRFECINEDGLNVNNSIGSSDVAFRTSEWITFNEDPLPLSLDNGTRASSQNLTAGFDRINWIRNITNNNPDDEPLETIVRTFLVNNDTGRIYGLLNEGSESVRDRGVARGNSTSTFDHLISRTAPSGLYHITLVFDAIYKAQFPVAQYIKLTNAFNVTSIKDTVELNEVIVEDFFFNRLNTSTTTQSSTTLPDSNSTAPFTILTEGFHSEFCLNLTNKRNDEVEIFLESLILENPTISVSKVLVTLDNEEEADIVASATETLCFDNILPTNLATHSDYRFSYLFRLGNTEGPFTCEQCDFTGRTDFFYVATIEDTIDIPKFIVSPSSDFLGRPGVFIMNKENEKLYMFDDYNYTDQSTTPWDNSTTACRDKEDGSSRLCDLSVYPSAGEPIKACFEAKSYFRDEISIAISDITIDRDSEESVTILRSEAMGEVLEHTVKSTTDPDMFIANAPSRAQEGDGNLTEGRNFFCTDWMDLPLGTYGGNDWDIQLEFKLNSEVHDLQEDLIWTVESDEFPIYGLFEQQPTWLLHLFSPRHYNIPEKWTKLSSTTYKFDLNVSVVGDGSSAFNFGEHVPFRLLDENAPFERLVNVTVNYTNGSAIPYSTELFTQFGEIVLLIEDVNLSLGDNNFTIIATTLDFANRSVVALEDIAGKTGTFHLSVECPNQFTIGKEMPCSITAQIEDTQLVQKEVDFTCFIDEGFSSINFNQMVTRTPVTIQRFFTLPTTFEGQSSHKLNCEAIYFNLGARKDTFFDSFSAVITAESNFGGGGGGTIGEVIDDFVDKLSDVVEDTIEGIKRNLVRILYFAIPLALIIFLIYRKSAEEKKLEDGE